MPRSRTRKGHRQKVAARNKAKKARANHLNKLFAEFSKKIVDAPDTVADLLNKEDAELSEHTIATTGGDEDYTIIDLPEPDPDEPVYVYTPRVLFDENIKEES